MKINIITLFPEAFESYFKLLPFKRAIKKEIIKINFINPRDFAIDKRGTVDDKPYGGGVGMLLRPEPIYNALKSINKTDKKNLKNERVIFLSPRGKRFKQQTAKKYSKLDEITFVCGRYEGFDERLYDFATDIVSLGDFVLSGGEIPTMAILEAVVRLLPGAIEKEEAVADESFENNSLEYPQYTRPEDFMGKRVPEVLLSGNHEEISRWRKSKRLTK